VGPEWVDMDVLYLLVTLGFFFIAAVYVRGCDRL
jgi:hypothetical protein